MSSTVGRNDPCVCGSGKKYKRCCFQQGHSASQTPGSRAMMIFVGAVLLLGLVFVVISIASGDGGACTPGQSFDASHGHCH